MHRGRRLLLAVPAVGVRTAVGRTPAVTGSVTVARHVRAATLHADMTRVRSDEARRDDALRTRGLETARYPDARFVLRDPVRLSSMEAQHAAGTLELHGERAPVTVSLRGRVAGDRLVLVGSVPIAFGDFGIEPPSVAGLVTVRDHGRLEFRLVLRSAA